MRSLGETGFAGSSANAGPAARARTVVAPASCRNCRRVGWRNVDMGPPDATRLGRAAGPVNEPRAPV